MFNCTDFSELKMYFKYSVISYMGKESEKEWVCISDIYICYIWVYIYI